MYWQNVFAGELTQALTERALTAMRKGPTLFTDMRNRPTLFTAQQGRIVPFLGTITVYFIHDG